jgi:transposase
MKNGTEKLVSDLQKENQILKIARQSAVEKIVLAEEEVTLAKETAIHLKEQNNQLEEQKKHLEEELKFLQFNYDQLKRMLFGAKRERFISNAVVNQMTLPFDVPTEPVTTPAVETIEYTRKKSSRENHHGRLELPSHLPVEEVIIEPEQSTEGLKCIGQEITSELDYTPASFLVRKYIRNKYAMLNGEGILIGTLPVRPIEKGIAGAGLLSNILVEKFVDHLPIYRQIERFKREKVKIPATTIDSWITQVSTLVEPLYEHLKKLVLAQGYLQVDETPIKVLDHKNKPGKTHQ